AVLGIARPLPAEGRVTVPQAAFVVAASIGRWAVFSTAALLGGTVIACALGLLPVGLGLDRVIAAVSVSRVAIGLGKAGVFGLLMILVSAKRRLLFCAVFEAIVVVALITAGGAPRWLSSREPFVLYAISDDGFGATVGSPVK